MLDRFRNLDRLSKLSKAGQDLLAERLQRTALANSGNQVIKRRHEEVPAPLSFAQQRLWFLDQLMPGSAMFNVPRAIRLRGTLNVRAMERTLSEIIRRHEALRTTFPVVDGRPVQEVAPPRPFTLARIDLQNLTEPEKSAKAQAMISEEALRPFDLTNGPLIRAGLLRLGEEDHTLLLTLHHIISDGWSTGVLIREMVLLYEAFLEEKPSPLAELPIQYADFASWQRQWLQGEVLDEQLSYWKQQLGEAPPVLELPTDRPRLALQTYKGATHHFTLPKQVAEKLKALSQQKGATLFMTLLAAFKTLLYRYSGQEDVVVGTPIANRNHVEIEGLIGFFVNTLVLRADLSGNPTFLELLDQVKEAALGAYAHQDLPFEKLVEEIQPERAPGMFPLYQVMFALQNAPKEKMALPGLTLEWSANVSETANYDFGLFMSEKDQAIAGGFHYNTDLFDEATMARMAEHFEVLLQEIVKDPARRVSDFEILTDPERNLLSVEWDHAEATAVRRCIHELFEEQAARQPDGAALSFEGEQTSYARLNARGNRMAHALRSLRPAEARTIAILLNPGMDQIASMLGVLKAGHTFVCLDSKYPVARLKQIMSDAEPSCLITESEYLSDPQGLLRQLVGEGDCEILAVDVAGGPTGEPGFDGRLYDSSYLETFPTTNLDVAVRPDGPAYLVYTSGSTGRPKAIVQSHGSFCQFIKWQSEQFAIQAPKRVAQWASISYDASYCEVFGALCFGATLCLATNSVRHDPAALVRWMRREEISLLQVVPSFCRQILQVLDAEDRSDHSNPFPHLEVVLLAGEVLNVDIAINWLERLGSHPRLFNLYGPTESVLATYYHVNSPEAIRYGVPVGRAIDGRQILVLDKRQNLCPIGVKGEIYIRSPFLTLGYLNRPEETQKAFLQNPLNGQYADPVYRTGDLGRWLPDGNLEFYGRVDNQVKIRGMRVELEDIESTLSTHDSISECAVVAHDYGEGDKRLVAYVVRDPDYNGRDEQISGEALGVLHVDQYQDVYDEIYSLSEAFSDSDPGLNFRVWTSSYTSEPFPEDEITECVNDTVGRILALKPTSVLEIACGTGLILFRVAPHCKRYCGTDISDTGVRYLQEQLEKCEPKIPGVTLLQRAAHEVGSMDGEKFDAVVINDVVPYFPTMDYLVSVLQNAADVLEDGGFIFLGGVRSLPLLDAFHTSVQLYRAPASLGRAELEQRVRKHIFSEKELLIDPAFFNTLKRHIPRLSHVQMLLKGGRYHNEVNRYQYDVIFYVGGEVESHTDIQWLDWQKEGLNLASIRQLLSDGEPEVLGVTQVPNSRLLSDIRAVELMKSGEGLETAGEIRESLRRITEGQGVDPEDVWALGKELPYHINIEWSGSAADGNYDVVFKRRRSDAEVFRGVVTSGPDYANEQKPWKEYSNDPLQQKFANKLAPQLRSFLRVSLPEHMVPSEYVFLDALPRTPNGKLDRKALLKPSDRLEESEGSYVAPRTTLESLIADIWQNLINVDKVGVNDNFFDLGGHSLLATQVINKVRQVCSVDIALRGFFESPTVASLAEKVEAAQEKSQSEIDKLAELIERVKQLSDDEVKELIAR